MIRVQNLLLVVVVGTGILLGAWLIPSGKEPSPQPPEPNPAETLPARVQQHLRQAHQQTKQAIEESFAPLDHFFARVKRGTPAFAEEVLSFSGKWNYLFSSEEEYKKYLLEQFAKKVLNPQELKKAVGQCIALYLQECQNIDNELFLSLRADVPDLERQAVHAEAFSGQVDRAMAEILKRSGDKVWESLVWDSGVGSVAVFLGEEFIVYVITQVASRAGLLAISGAGGWQTLGLSIVVGLILDRLWKWFSDPEGDLAGKLNQKLDQLHQELRHELQHRMLQMAHARQKARLQIIQKALRE